MEFYRFNIAAILLDISVLYSLYRIKLIKTNTLRVFVMLLYLGLGTSISDLIFGLLQLHPETHSVALLFTVKTFYQLIYHTIPVTYFYCSYFLTNDNKIPSKKMNYLYSTPYFITVFLILLNIFTKNLFYFDNFNNYHHGTLSVLLYLEAVYYVILAFIRYIRYRLSLHISQIITVFSYSILCVVIVFMQLIDPHIRVMGFLLSISILLGYLSLENPSNYVDKQMGIFNNNGFAAQTKSLLEVNRPLFLLHVKMIGLDYVYDFLGHETYDVLMTNIADYFKENYASKSVFRYNVNSLVLYLDNDHEVRNQQLLELNKRFAQSFECGNTEISVSFYTNLISIPEDLSTYDELITILDAFLESDEAIKQNIRDSKNEAALKKQRESHIIDLLDKAILQNGFEVYYQPIYSIVNNKFSSAEALIRLKNSDIGYISPEEFIPIAEKNGMITRIGKIVISEVCHFLSTYKIWEYGIETVNINLSSIQIMQEQFVSYFKSTIEAFSLSPQYISFELMDSSSDAANLSIRKNINSLKDLGAKFLIDRYGVGSSTISTISGFPFKALKIDKDVVWTTLSDDKAKVILKETISMIKSLNVNVVAEGVETHQQAVELLKMGCEYLQGYYYSEPLPAFEFFQFMKI